MPAAAAPTAAGCPTAPHRPVAPLLPLPSVSWLSFPTAARCTILILPRPTLPALMRVQEAFNTYKEVRGNIAQGMEFYAAFQVRHRASSRRTCTPRGTASVGCSLGALVGQGHVARVALLLAHPALG